MTPLSTLAEKIKNKYKYTAYFYDFLDYPWERMYRHWRPELLKEVRGSVLEAGVGTGRNLAYYDKSVQLTAVDLSPEMLRMAEKRARNADCQVKLLQMDASKMAKLNDSSFDWFISTFLCCVMPNELQPQTLDQMVRVLKPGGHFKILEMVFSKNEKVEKFQRRIMPLVEFVYGARFDRNTLALLQAHPKIQIDSICFLKDDTYQLIEGKKL